MVNRHPQTGKIISAEDAQRLAERQPMAHPQRDLLAPNTDPVVVDEPIDETPFVPMRVWSAGPGMPQQKIFVPGKAGGLRPGHDGSYSLATREDYIAAKKALGPQFWPDNVPAGEPSPKCDTCQWTTRSYAALMHHVNQAHGRPQR